MGMTASLSKKGFKEKYDLSLNTQKFILQMNWAQHDAQWFLKAKKEVGTPKANQLNQNVLSSMGKIEARNVLNALNISKGTINSMTEIFKLMNTFMDLFIPKVMEFKFIVESQTKGVGIVNKCFIWQMVQKSKAEAEYVCACNYRHRGWLDAMGVSGTIVPLKRISEGDDRCEFEFNLQDVPELTD